MKKIIYLVLTLLTTTHSTVTKKATNSLIVASTLLLSPTKSKQTFSTTLSIDLHKAVEKGNYTEVKNLITNDKVDINAKVDYGTSWSNNHGCTPLIWCCKKGDKWLNIAKALLAHDNIDVNLEDKDGYTPLTQCCYEGDKSFKIAKVLLRHKKTDVNLKDTEWGITPLMWCCNQGDNKSLKIAKALLEHRGTDVNLQNGEEGYSPLTMCCQKGETSLRIVQALLQHKRIDVNLQDKNGNTPLDTIIHCSIIENKQSQAYLNLWNMLVAKGGMLNKHIRTYKKLKLNNYKGPEKAYIQWIKSTPPINFAPFTQQLIQERNGLRNQIEQLRKTNIQQLQKLQQDNDVLNHKLTITKQKNKQHVRVTKNYLNKINNQKKGTQNKDRKIKKLKEQIQNHLRRVGYLKNEVNNVNHRFEAFKQIVKQKTKCLRDEFRTIVNEIDTHQKNLEKERDELQNMLHIADQQVEKHMNTIEKYLKRMNAQEKIIQNNYKEIENLKHETKNTMSWLFSRFKTKLEKEKNDASQNLLHTPKENIKKIS